MVPLAELFIAPNPANLDAAEEQLAKANKGYDFILWCTIPFQYFLLYTFLTHIGSSQSNLDTLGSIIGMGLLCGAFGINVAHELGHRTNKFEQFLAKSLLLTSLYMHFFIEHNKGHHKHVATPDDPSTAKFKQSVYAFWVQTFIGTYLSAWHIAIEDAKKKQRFMPVLFNEMMLFQLIQIGLLLLIYINFGFIITAYFIFAALIGAILLETVNYIEHYGLQREKGAGALFERVQPHHSWNSNHIIGRLMLFELSRHSDHHYMASRKYQVLRNMDEAPQMPTGYPGMIILSLFPPLWFKIMHQQMRKYRLLPNN
jgi:alkane 1-monooxygenase